MSGQSDDHLDPRSTADGDRPLPSQSHESARRWLLRIVDLSLAGVVFLAPLFMGGRQPPGQFVFVTLVCVAAVAWFARQCLSTEGRYTRSGAELLILAGVLLVGLQLLPLSQTWIARLSPGIGETLPAWTANSDAPVSLGRWSHLSLTPYATRGGLVMYLAYAMLFVVVVGRIRKAEDVERLLRWIGLAAVGMAAFGIVQFFASNGEFCWIYEHPFRDTRNVVKGSFINQNHFAHFLALGIGPLLWWGHRFWRRRDEQRTKGFGLAADENRRQMRLMIVAGALGLVTFAAMLSFSRGGVAVAVLATVVCVGIYAWRSLLGKRSLIALAGFAALIGAALFIHGYRRLADEVDSVVAAESMADLSAGRKDLWEAVASGIRDFPVIGAGVGSHREVYPMYLQGHSFVEYTHAESGYLQVLLETGVPGLTLLLMGISLCGFWCVRTLLVSDSIRLTACMGAVTAGFVASVAHSIVDFVWYIPACMSLTVVLMACACRLHQFVALRDGGRRKEVALPRLAWAAIAIAVLIVSVGSVKNRLGPAMASRHWDRYLALSIPLKHLDPKDERHEASVEPAMEHLENVLRANPNDPRANLRMATVCLRRFDSAQKHAENAMPLVQIRDAAVASRSSFSSREELDRWLAVVVKENRVYLDRAWRHARHGLRGCPLQGEGYLFLAELGFLYGEDERAKTVYVQQALAVRPHQGPVLFAAGKEAALAGDISEALQFWKEAFRKDPTVRLPIIQALDQKVGGREVPAMFFVNTFEPDVKGLKTLYNHYRTQESSDQLPYVGRCYASELERIARTESGKKAAGRWYSAHFVYRKIGEHTRALQCIRRAVDSAPNESNMRRDLAARLMEQQHYEEAVEQLTWLLRRNPDNDWAQRSLKTASKARIDSSATRPTKRTDRGKRNVFR